MYKYTKVLKFGGSSLGDANRIKNACKIISEAAQNCRIAVVVSAIQGVTDKLLAFDFAWVQKKHTEAAKALRVPVPAALLAELQSVIESAKRLGDVSPMILDRIASFGERLSAELVAAYLKKAVLVDARELIKTNSYFQNALVDFKKTNVKIRSFFKPLIHNSQCIIPVVTGFIASDERGRTTTLGRGGSDYTASIIGSALGVQTIEIWTDVNGVMSADPRIVPAAVTLSEISYHEAFEMAYFGAKVLYPPTMLPAVQKHIPIVIKNTLNAAHPGTVVNKESRIKNQDLGAVKNISAINGISLIMVGGTNLAGVPGTAERVFAAIARAKVNVILISQASSEQSICFAVNKNDVSRAFHALENAFSEECRRGLVAITVKENQSIIAAVGDNMRGTPGIAGALFSALGARGISVAAIAQGASERNVSFAVAAADKEKAIRALHDAFFADGVSLFIVGTGVVGSELLRQLGILNHPSFQVCGIANDKKMAFDPSGIPIARWKSIMRKGVAPDIGELIAKGERMGGEKIFVDCTASEKIARLYPRLVRAGFHIVTPNKKANVLSQRAYDALRSDLARHKKVFRYETNVGAGLPIFSTLANFRAVGDAVTKIEGIFSGTLSYLFNNYDPDASVGAGGKKKFSELVEEARKKGYTEPDPREDLSGMDVARKLLILARELGHHAELTNVKIESLLKPDAYFAERFKKAKKNGAVLRYVGTFAHGKLSAKLQEVPLHHPLSSVQGADNVFAFYTKYYPHGLVVKGPGAGAKVTAAGVLNDILSIWKDLK